MDKCFTLVLYCSVLNFLTVFTVFAQNVRVEPLSPQPACPNELLVYNCRVQFLSVSITWRHGAFGYLGFSAADDKGGDFNSTSDGRVVANLTMNNGTGGHRMVASTLTIQPPLNDLNGTTLTCEGFEVPGGNRSGTATILLAGECMAEIFVYYERSTLFNVHFTFCRHRLATIAT